MKSKPGYFVLVNNRRNVKLSILPHNRLLRGIFMPMLLTSLKAHR